MGFRQNQPHRHLPFFLAVVVCLSVFFTGCSASESSSSQRSSSLEKKREVYSIEEMEKYIRSGEYASLSRYYVPALLPENVRLQSIELTQSSILLHYTVQDEDNLSATEDTEETEEDGSRTVIQIIPAEEAAASDPSSASSSSQAETTSELDEAARLQLEMERQKREYVFAWDWRDDGETLLEKSKQHYGTETEINGITYYQYMLQGNGEILAYQFRWVEDGHLFYMKIPAEIADSISNLADYLEIEEIPL